ncbi:hypothetical protein BDA96_01G308600 [Sorghum bicolor]|uniref:Uncharacterized protein n=2 Tax=Sorghum bicolor TaxID=4558 RepID=A0A921UZC9_SORBI|nr:hypothetical protein SORBI_3001G284700 [Sorghum bicolor]KAG0550077.1 hypothetical protein BDA96_01G308600 [Sorghum bicolor]
MLSGSELTSNRSSLDDHRSGWPVEARGVRAASSTKQNHQGNLGGISFRAVRVCLLVQEGSSFHRDCSLL